MIIPPFYGAAVRKLSPKVQKLMETRTQTDAVFCVESNLKNYYIAAINFMKKFLWCCAIICVILLVVGFMFAPIETEEDYKYIYGIIYIAATFALLPVFANVYLKYYKAKNVLFYEDYIIVQRANKQRFVTYDELGKVIREHGLRIRRGKIELPIKGCNIACEVRTALNKDEPILLIEFIGKKCCIEFPQLTYEEMKMIQREGHMHLWWIIQKALILIDIYVASIFSIVPAFDGDKTGIVFIAKRFIADYWIFGKSYNEVFVFHGVEIFFGGFVALLSWPQYFWNFFKVRKHFKNNKYYRVY